MKKRTYIQPEMEMAVMPKYAMMDFPASPGQSLNPGAGSGARRRTPVF